MSAPQQTLSATWADSSMPFTTSQSDETSPPSQFIDRTVFKFKDLPRELRDLIYESYLINACPKLQLSYMCRKFSPLTEAENLILPRLTCHVDGFMMVSKQVRHELMASICRRPITWRGRLTSSSWRGFKRNLLPKIRDLTIVVGPEVTVIHAWDDLDNEIRRLLKWVHRCLSRRRPPAPWRLEKLTLMGYPSRSLLKMYREETAFYRAIESDWKDYPMLSKIRGRGIEGEVYGNHPDTGAIIEAIFHPTLSGSWIGFQS